MSIEFKIDFVRKWEIKMDKIFWYHFHSTMALTLFVLWMFSVIVKETKDIRKEFEVTEKNSKRDIIEKVVLILILCIIGFVMYVSIKKLVLNRLVVNTYLVAIYLLVYAYIAIKKIIRMIFIPEKREFSTSDIQGFVVTYLFWWMMVVAMGSLQSQMDLLSGVPSDYREAVKVLVLLLCYYFNIVFALGGVYILLNFLRKIFEKLQNVFKPISEKIRKWVDRLCDSWKHVKRFTGLRSFELWKEKGKGVVFKILVFIPFLLFDVLNITWILVKIFGLFLLAEVVLAIIKPIKEICNLTRKIWNRHKNNEWMYVFAQIAGLCSYVIVYLMIQYGKYDEVTKTVYEFVGTIVLIPYFLGKIVSIKKNLKETEIEESRKEDKEIVIPDNMTYNEDGEGVINGKTIRQLEYEAMQYAANNPQVVKLNNKELKEELRRIRRNGFREKAGRFIENYIEIVIGVCISVCLMCLYFVFRHENAEENVGLIGSIIGAEGTIISVLLTIAFTKRSNKKALGASVLPYISIEKQKEPVEGAYAFEYFKVKEKEYDFSGWKPFDFGTIQNDKIKMVRNGMAYLHIKNIGIGPAIHIRMKIENFSSVFLPIDYLRPDDEMYVILNFNNPDQSYKTDIIFEYETIRGDKHTQRFRANITWHLDRTNFTLFG